MKDEIIDRVCNYLREQEDLIMLMALASKQEEDRLGFTEISMDVSMVIKRLQSKKH